MAEPASTSLKKCIPTTILEIATFAASTSSKGMTSDKNEPSEQAQQKPCRMARGK